VPYYADRGILVTVDADQAPDSVTAAIQARLSPPGKRKESV
jgi:adenylate kinase family enzyme